MNKPGAFQLGIPPFTFRCFGCLMEWDPQPVTRGPTKGQHSDASLDKAYADHLKEHHRD